MLSQNNKNTTKIAVVLELLSYQDQKDLAFSSAHEVLLVQTALVTSAEGCNL